MKKIALTLLFKLLKKYAPEAIAYIFTHLFAYLTNKYGISNYNRVVKEATDIQKAMNSIISVAADGKVTPDEVKDLMPLIKEAFKVN